MKRIKRVLASHPHMWWWLASVYVLAFLAGLFQYERRMDSALAALSSEHLNLLSLGNSEFNRRLGDIRNSTRLLDSHIQDLLIQQTSMKPSRAFKRVGSSLDNISQLRWIDLSGKEKIRIDFMDFFLTETDEDALQDKSDRPYFKAIKNTLPGTLLLSRVTLNREKGRVVIPHEPTIRAMLHTASSHPLGEGFLVVNFRLTQLLAFIKGLSTANSSLWLADDTPQWMIHSNPEKLWSGKVGGPPLDIPDTWERLTSANAVYAFIAQDSQVFSINTLTIHLSEQTDQAQKLYFIAQTPASYYQQICQRSLIPAIATALVLLIIGSIALYRELITSYRIQQLGIKLSNEKRELQDALQLQDQLREELVEIEKMASLGMLVAGVAHELNTPLGTAVMSISGQQRALQDLKKEIASGLRKSALESYLNKTDASTQLALSNLQRASSLIERFKRLSVDRSSEQSSHFHLLQNVNDIINAMGPQLKHVPVEIKLDIPKSIYLTSYPGIVSQVLQNLINNCLTHAFMPGQHGIVAISAVKSQDRVLLHVKDNGNGIDPSVAQTLFDPFVTSGRHKGNTGLGLHLIHQWVTQMLEGSIKVAKVDGGGTLFILNVAANVEQTNSARHTSANS